MSTMALEFDQAMSDFTTMFPEMDREVIEAVLRCNKGQVDATIDQLLAMSTDNQNEKLRNELDKPDGRGVVKSSPISTPSRQPLSRPPKSNEIDLLSSSPVLNTGASPKVRKSIPTSIKPSLSKWCPPMLLPLPQNFLRISLERTESEFPDEQFALMLQNEEFMKELRWNEEFLLALEKEHQDKAKVDDDAAFKERLKHMGKKSRKKFQQLAKVFTWQKNKKPGAVRHPDSLLLQEEHSDDEGDIRRNRK